MEKRKIFNRALLEDYHKESSDEIQMAKIQLKSIMADAADILQQLEGHEQLDSWIQSKLTMADDYLTTVKKYLQFEEEKPIKELPLVPSSSDIEMPSMTADIEGEPEEEDLSIFSQGPEEETDIHIESDLDDAEEEAESEESEEYGENEDQFAEDDVPEGESMADLEIDLNESIIMSRLI